MSVYKRLALGAFLGAICGAVLTALCLKLPPVNQYIGTYGCDFQIAFGRFFGEHISSIPISLGTIIGAAIFGSLGVSKRCCALMLLFIAGIAIGGASMFFVEVKVVRWASGVFEDNAASERASAYLEALRAMDRAATNQLYITKFQAVGRSVLAEYLHETEERMQNFENTESMDFLFTNSATYHITQRYLATHTNTLPVGSDF
jgi:hypothetical protein